MITITDALPVDLDIVGTRVARRPQHHGARWKTSHFINHEGWNTPGDHSVAETGGKRHTLSTTETVGKRHTLSTTKVHAGRPQHRSAAHEREAECNAPQVPHLPLILAFLASAMTVVGYCDGPQKMLRLSVRGCPSCVPVRGCRLRTLFLLPLPPPPTLSHHDLPV